jgi:hypothetical protein
LIWAPCHRPTGNTNTVSKLTTGFQIIIKKGNDWFKSLISENGIKIIASPATYATSYRLQGTPISTTNLNLIINTIKEVYAALNTQTDKRAYKEET